MNQFFYKIGVSSLLLFVIVGQVSASTLISTSSALNREAAPLIKAAPTPIAKAWINSRIKEFSTNLKYAQGLRATDAKLYQQDLAQVVTKYVEDIRNNAYSFVVSESEKRQVESTILAYQQEFTQELKKYIDRYKNNDARQTGDMHFTLESKDIKIDINLDRYTVTQSRDLKNMEMDVVLSMRVSGVELDGYVAITLDGSVLIIDDDVYFTLRDVSFSTSVDDPSILEYQKLLTSIEGKTYHQTLDTTTLGLLRQDASSIELTEKVIAILDSRSILTPVAKQGEEYMLMFNKNAIREFQKLTGEVQSDISLKNLLIPADIRIRGEDIHFHGYMKNIELDATLSRDSDKTVIMDISGVERGGYSKLSWKLSKTPTFWALAWSSEGYTLDTTADKNGAKATIKKDDAIIAQASISRTSEMSWTYDMRATIEDSTYDWETGEAIIEKIMMRLWGSMRDEFGEFKLVPPTIYEELENSTFKKIERDTTRRSDISNISSDFYYYGYPRVAKNGCISSVNYRRYGWNPYKSYQDPKSLSTGTCPDGYFYKLFTDADGTSNYVLATRTETREFANYDASIVDITKATYDTIYNNISSGAIATTNPDNWYYVLTSGSTIDGYDY